MYLKTVIYAEYLTNTMSLVPLTFILKSKSPGNQDITYAKETIMTCQSFGVLPSQENFGGLFAQVAEVADRM